MPETILASNLLEEGANRKCTGSGPNVNPAHYRNPAASSVFQAYQDFQHLLGRAVQTGSAPEVTKTDVNVPELSLRCF